MVLPLLHGSNDGDAPCDMVLMMVLPLLNGCGDGVARGYIWSLRRLCHRGLFVYTTAVAAVGASAEAARQQNREPITH